MWNIKEIDKWSSDLIDLKPIWLNSPDMMKTYFIIFIHHSQPKLAMYHFSKVASRVEVTKMNLSNGGDENALELKKRRVKM